MAHLAPFVQTLAPVVVAQVVATLDAHLADAAKQMPLARDVVADAEALDGRTDGDDLAGEFVADDARRLDAVLRPRVPVVDVQVRTADAGAKDANEDVVEARLRDRHFFEPQSLLASAFDDRSHCPRHLVASALSVHAGACRRPSRREHAR